MPCRRADPYLARLSDGDRALVQAGFHYYAGNVAHEAGDTTAADDHGRSFRALVPDVFRPSAAAPDRSTVGQ